MSYQAGFLERIQYGRILGELRAQDVAQRPFVEALPELPPSAGLRVQRRSLLGRDSQ
jgi:hypothetical protein